ncbi:protein GVQW3-like [Contarinia nasturtii]|uniref:protein GVQW3-like n=1 Tax=Contarinia nasturtii TaxID=265458 RepID=UPI0012D42E2E|nr:protein GVQW3-like [Contarinia nasturtii]
MDFKQRAAIESCVKLGKTFTKTHQMLQQAYGRDCLSRSRVHEWFKRFKSGRETLNDDKRSGRPKSGISAKNIKKVREFIKNNEKCSVKLIEMELGIPATTVFRILTEELGLRKVNSRFLPHKLTDDQKMDLIEHCKDIIESAPHEWRRPDEGHPTKSHLEKSKVKSHKNT